MKLLFKILVIYNIKKGSQHMKFYTFCKYIFCSAAILLVYLFLFATPKAFSNIDNKTLTLNVIPLKPQQVDVTSEYVGYIIPIQSVDIKANVSGYVDEVWAEGGQEVKEGDNLVLIDQREYKAKYDAAKSKTAQAKADYNNSLTYYNRVKKAGKKVMSASAIDDAKAKFLAAEASLKQAKAEEEQAKVSFDYTVLQAPINGTLGNVDLTKGNYVAPSSAALFNIIQFNPIRVMFAVSDKEYLSEITKHSGVNIFNDVQISLRLADGSIYKEKGKFRFTDNQIDKTTNSISVFADFINNDKVLVANSYVDVLLSKKLKDVYLINQNYATLTNKGAFIYVIEKNKLKQVLLKIVGYFEDAYVVENKFRSDEFLVTDRVGKIASGTTIKMKLPTQNTEKN